MGLKVINISKSSEIVAKLKEAYNTGPVFCNIEINPDQALSVLKSGASLDNQIPLLPLRDLTNSVNLILKLKRDTHDNKL